MTKRELEDLKEITVNGKKVKTDSIDVLGRDYKTLIGLSGANLKTLAKTLELIKGTKINFNFIHTLDKISIIKLLLIADNSKAEAKRIVEAKKKEMSNAFSNNGKGVKEYFVKQKKVGESINSELYDVYLKLIADGKLKVENIENSKDRKIVTELLEKETKEAENK